MPELVYTRPTLYPKQESAFFNPARYALTEASTKAGKTVAAIVWIIEQALSGSSGQNFWWVAPVSSQSDIAFRRVKQGLPVGAFTARESPTPIITLINGAMIWFKSGDNPDSLYGEDVIAAVCDEASRIKEESWHALRSTVTATQGLIRIIGNVKGRRNWFYRLARIAQTDGMAANMHYAKITVMDAIEAGVIPQSEVEDARRTLPENVFRELYMAEPGDDSGNPFGLDHIGACIGHLSDAPPAAFGVDLAKKRDWLVVTGLDVEGHVCAFQRWQGVPWRESIRRIHEIVGEDVPALVDSTGIGDPVLEELQVGHGNFRGYMFSQISKQRLMEGLAVSIQGHEITYPDGPIRSELESFEYELTRTGVRYSAPEGSNDDCVCSLALAREQLTTVAPATNLMQYYFDSAKAAKAAEASRLEDNDRAGGGSLPSSFLRGSANGWDQTGNAAATLDNELTELYRATLAQYEPEARCCRRCGGAIGRTRSTDGVHVWHPECVG